MCFVFYTDQAPNVEARQIYNIYYYVGTEAKQNAITLLDNLTTFLYFDNMAVIRNFAHLLLYQICLFL